MIRDDVCWLIKETPGGHGVFDKPTRTERMVFCSVESVRSSEFWRAKTAGSDLAMVFVLSNYLEYDGERLLRWENGGTSRYYRIVRSYVTEESVELTCEEVEAYDLDSAAAGNGAG